MSERYDVYFAGQLMDGQNLNAVRDKLAKLFNADEETLNRLFGGGLQVVKRNCDHTTAQKYKAALERAGAIPVIQPAETATRGENDGASGGTNSAEKIAALAAAPDERSYQQPPPDSTPNHHTEEPAGGSGGLGLAPSGTAVLREDERTEIVPREIDTSSLQVDTTAERISEESTPGPAAPDVGHISMGEVGESIPNLSSNIAPVSPNIDALALSEPGTDLSDCATPLAEVVPVDLSALKIEPPGATLLEEKYRTRDPGVTPSTDHISLED
jgi:hypothetical protein